MKRLQNHMSKLFCLGVAFMSFHWGDVVGGWCAFGAYFFISLFVSNEDSK